MVPKLAQQVSDDCVSFVADVYTVAAVGNLRETWIGVRAIVQRVQIQHGNAGRCAGPAHVLVQSNHEGVVHIHIRRPVAVGTGIVVENPGEDGA